MPYISNTKAERQAMLEKIGVANFEELITAIPEKMRLTGMLDLDEPLSELEITRGIKSQTCKDVCTQAVNSFLGAGCYDHFIPAAVDTIISRPEFFTAYTPYQAEVSQGTLQFIYEYQTMVCELTGMEIANASMYDAASAIAEAILMAVRKNKLSKAILPATLHPEYYKVIKIYTEGLDIELLTAPMKDGLIDLEALDKMMSDDIGSVILQSPNFFGNIEDGEVIGKIVKKNPAALFIVCSDPVSLAVLKAPASFGADICVGEGQALGNNMNLGGPLFGFFATRIDMARQMPGRIVGGTLDIEGRRAYALTLQAREQHIRRAKATSNICSNQSLCTLAACVYMSLMGRQGLIEVATQSAQKAHYLARNIATIPGYQLRYPQAAFFKEFVISTPIDAALIIEKLLPLGIYPGVNMQRFGYRNELMLAVTEKKTRAEMDALIKALKEI